MDGRFWAWAVIGITAGLFLSLLMGVSLAGAGLITSDGTSTWSTSPIVLPEPATMAFLGVGLMGLLLLRRKYH